MTSIIDEATVRRLVPMRDCIDLIRDAFQTLASGDAVQPLRSATWLPDRSGLLGLMPGVLGDDAFGVKVVTVFPRNHERGLESHQGVVLLFDPDTGALEAVIDAASVTAIRTAAASAVATDVLARRDADDLLVVGSGVQAVEHIEAIGCVRDLARVRVWSRNTAHAERCAARAHERCGTSVEVAVDLAAAARTASIICTVTASTEPVLAGAWLAPGAHVNAVGACTRDARELDSDAVANARLVVDRRESAENESGDYLVPLDEGRFGKDHIAGELGDVLTGAVAGRTSAEEITLYDSLGLAVQDLAMCRVVLDRVRAEVDA